MLRYIVLIVTYFNAVIHLSARFKTYINLNLLRTVKSWGICPCMNQLHV